MPKADHIQQFYQLMMSVYNWHNTSPSSALSILNYNRQLYGFLVFILHNIMLSFLSAFTSANKVSSVSIHAYCQSFGLSVLPIGMSLNKPPSNYFPVVYVCWTILNFLNPCTRYIFDIMIISFETTLDLWWIIFIIYSTYSKY